MNALLAMVRAAHYASAMLLFGELVFVFIVARPAWQGARAVGPGEPDAIHRRLLRIARWTVVSGAVSAVAWLAIVAAVMSGAPIAQAVNREALGLVLENTAFGHVWLLRLGLLAAYCALLLALASSTPGRVRSRLTVGMLAIAAAYLAALAWAGHAGAGQGSDGDAEIASAVVHLLAAGAWLGALPGLVFLLGRARPLAEAAQATRRFSTLGALCVALLTASGLVNAWYRVGEVPALIGTDYGRLLVAKLALLAVMLVLAMANRWYLSVRLAGGDREALSLLRRNAVLEIVAGIGVVTIVGALGVTVPAVHQTPVWPFDRTVSWERVEQSAWLQMGLAAAGMIACVSAGVAIAGVRRRRARQWLAGLAGIVAPAAIFAGLLAGPAYPTSYTVSPVRYTTDAIVHGAVLYASNCRVCHEGDGRGTGPAASSVPTRSTDLTDRVSRHREGDLFWWVARGIAGTPMPGFAPGLSDTDIWQLVKFLYAQAEARDALAMTDGMKLLSPMVAPEFTFEISGQSQESLHQLRGNRVALLVLYTLPESLPRLRELSTHARAYAAAGARVIAVPLHPPSIAAEGGIPGNGSAIFASAGADVAIAYTLFARQPAGTANNAPAHVEFLIDRQGDLRVRWTGVAAAGARWTTETLARIDILNREPPRRPAPWGHGHR